jgi:hypothetical protein
MRRSILRVLPLCLPSNQITVAGKSFEALLFGASDPWATATRPARLWAMARSLAAAAVTAAYK